MSASRRSLLFTSPRQVEVREEPLLPPGPGEVLVQTLVSAISPGTEMLVYRGQVPTDMALDASIPGMAGAFSYPVKYGYASVGCVVEAGENVSADCVGTLVFSLHPHESHYVADTDHVSPVPPGIAADHAALYPHAETAVTFLLDGRPMIGEDVVVVGQGVVGLMTTAFLARFPLARLVAIDRHALRRKLSLVLGAHRSVDATDAADVQGLAGSFDLAYELSGSPDALDLAVATTGFHGRVVVGSWYGDRRVELGLGGAFHRSRITISSSQVSTIDPTLEGRWDRARRAAVAWRMLAKVDAGPLISHRFPFAEAAAAYELIDRHPEETVQVLLDYEA